MSTLTDKTDLRAWLLRASQAIYLATDQDDAADLADGLTKTVARLDELDTMVQRLGNALLRCTDDFLKLADLDKTIAENDDKIEIILAQIEAHRQKGKPS